MEFPSHLNSFISKKNAAHLNISMSKYFKEFTPGFHYLPLHSPKERRISSTPKVFFDWQSTSRKRAVPAPCTRLDQPERRIVDREKPLEKTKVWGIIMKYLWIQYLIHFELCQQNIEQTSFLCVSITNLQEPCSFDRSRPSAEAALWPRDIRTIGQREDLQEKALARNYLGENHPTFLVGKSRIIRHVRCFLLFKGILESQKKMTNKI